MTAPRCCAWCRPAEGVHVFVDARCIPAEECMPGGINVMDFDECCGPAGTVVRTLSVEPASAEVPPPPGWPADLYPYLTVETVQVVKR